MAVGVRKGGGGSGAVGGSGEVDVVWATQDGVVGWGELAWVGIRCDGVGLDWMW